MQHEKTSDKSLCMIAMLAKKGAIQKVFVSPDSESGEQTTANLRDSDLTLSEDPQLIVYIHWLIVENSYNVQIPAHPSPHYMRRMSV